MTDLDAVTANPAPSNTASSAPADGAAIADGAAGAHVTGGAAGDDGAETLAFECPRCGQSVQARFYGPCDPCRQQLRVTMSGEGQEVEAAEYEPKMNVTPNAVATKD